MAKKDTKKDYGGGKDASEQQRFWGNQISAAKKEVEPWHTQAQKVVNVYLDKRSRGTNSHRRFNMFTTNTNNLMAALFSRIPKPDVSRRFKDPNDHAGRVAANIIQRALVTEMQNDSYFTSVAKNTIKDRLVPGAGFVWVRYVADVDKQPLQITDNVNDEAGEFEDANPVIKSERTPAEHIHWKDFLWSPARTWNEVTWVARRAYMDKVEFTERFPSHAELVSAQNLESIAMLNEDDEPTKENEVQVWEIWDKSSKKVYFYTEGYDKILDTKEDPFGLPNFFPCPKPLFANVSTSAFVPKPDYVFVQDQYEQLNELVARKAELIRACKVAGAYSAENEELKDILEGEENTLIPIKNWGSFMNEGGVSGAISWVPIQNIAAVIGLLDRDMVSVKQQIEELTGISDIIRGSTSPYETASAQAMKGQYASQRFNSNQTEVAEFFSEMIGIKAFLMAKFYEPEMLLRQAGMLPIEGVFMPGPDMQYVAAAMQLLKDELLSHINVEISVDALVAGTDAAAMQQKNAVMQTLASLLQQVFPVIQQAPETKEFFLQMIKTQIAGMPGAKDLEGSIDQQLTKLLGAPDEEAQAAMAAQAEQQRQAAEAAQAQKEQAEAQERMAMEQAKLQNAVAIEQARGQTQLQLKQMDLEHDTLAGRAKIEASTLEGRAKLELEQLKLQLEVRKADLEVRKTRMEELRLISELQIDPQELAMPIGDGMMNQREAMMQQFAQFTMQIEQSQAMMAEQQARMTETLNMLMTAPEPTTQVQIERDSAGKIVGATIS